MGFHRFSDTGSLDPNHFFHALNSYWFRGETFVFRCSLLLFESKFSRIGRPFMKKLRSGERGGMNQLQIGQAFLQLQLLPTVTSWEALSRDIKPGGGHCEISSRSWT